MNISRFRLYSKKRIGDGRFYSEIDSSSISADYEIKLKEKRKLNSLISLVYL